MSTPPDNNNGDDDTFNLPDDAFLFTEIVTLLTRLSDRMAESEKKIRRKPDGSHDYSRLPVHLSLRHQRDSFVWRTLLTGLRHITPGVVLEQKAFEKTVMGMFAGGADTVVVTRGDDDNDDDDGMLPGEEPTAPVEQQASPQSTSNKPGTRKKQVH